MHHRCSISLYNCMLLLFKTSFIFNRSPHIKPRCSNLPVVFLSIGTNAEWNKELASVFADAFRASRDQYRVLWSVKDYQREKFLPASLSDNVMTVPFVEQIAVLAHRNVKAFITHCGMGSLQEAIFYQVPIIAYPVMESDQPTNAAFAVHKIKIGHSFDPLKDVISASELNSKLLSILNGEDGVSFKKNLARLSRAMQVLNGPARAVQLVQLFIETGYDYFVPIETELTFVELYSIDLYLFFAAVAVGVWLLVKKVCCGRRGGSSSSSSSSGRVESEKQQKKNN